MKYYFGSMMLVVEFLFYVVCDEFYSMSCMNNILTSLSGAPSFSSLGTLMEYAKDNCWFRYVIFFVWRLKTVMGGSSMFLVPLCFVSYLTLRIHILVRCWVWTESRWIYWNLYWHSNLDFWNLGSSSLILLPTMPFVKIDSLSFSFHP